MSHAAPRGIPNTEEERGKILQLAAHPDIKKKLMASMAPSIHGRDDIKLTLLLALLGGVPKDVSGDQSHKIRGDINVLLVGDPGTTKSQFLKFVEKTADRAVFTTGRGSSSVGLTAAVQRDPVTGDFTLEGGALVIADKGVCLIDEFDKMNGVDRTSIHEAMEQQTISVARGGIVTTLSARCSVMAAASPIGGHYDPSVSFDANVDLTSPILSRFDVLLVVRDEVHTDADEKLAQFVCTSHQRSHHRMQAEAKRLETAATTRALQQQQQQQHPNGEEDAAGTQQQTPPPAGAPPQPTAASSSTWLADDDPSTDRPLKQHLLRAYIQYAKSHCTPRITHIDEHTLTHLYAELRQESKLGGIPITVRHMESIIRLSEAHARIYLREFVRNEDVSGAIALFLRSFVGAQKYSLGHTLENKFRKYLDSDLDPLYLVHHRLKTLVFQQRSFDRQMSGGIETTTVYVECAEFDALLATMNVSRESMDRYYESAMFRKEFELERDSSGRPKRIAHVQV